jgi:hypothetical protein
MHGLSYQTRQETQLHPITSHSSDIQQIQNPTLAAGFVASTMNIGIHKDHNMKYQEALPHIQNLSIIKHQLPTPQPSNADLFETVQDPSKPCVPSPSMASPSSPTVPLRQTIISPVKRMTKGAQRYTYPLEGSHSKFTITHKGNRNCHWEKNKKRLGVSEEKMDVLNGVELPPTAKGVTRRLGLAVNSKDQRLGVKKESFRRTIKTTRL